MTDRVEALRHERWESMEPAKRRGIVAARDRAALERMLDEGVRPFGFSDPPRTPADEGAQRQLGRVRAAVFERNDAIEAALAALRFAELAWRYHDRLLWPAAKRDFDAKLSQSRAASKGGKGRAAKSETRSQAIERSVRDAREKGNMSDVDARKFVAKKTELSLGHVSRICRDVRANR